MYWHAMKRPHHHRHRIDDEVAVLEFGVTGKKRCGHVVALASKLGTILRLLGRAGACIVCAIHFQERPGADQGLKHNC